MRQVNGFDSGLEVFHALGSDVRMRIVQLLAENERMNMNELASALGLTNGAVTAHVKKLEEAGIVSVTASHSGKGTQKICSLLVDQLLFNANPEEEVRSNFKIYETQTDIGYYSDYQVKQPCGLAGADGLIGTEDDPRSFAFSERIGAEMLWFHDGYIEYRIPNLLPAHQRIVQMTIDFEISSADHGMVDDSQSDVVFYLNGRKLGSWLSVLSPDNAHGIYTPLWWNRPERQRGFLKMLVLNEMGVFLDGAKISEGLPQSEFIDEAGDIRLRFEARPLDGHNGGFAIYGGGFGNYKQNIHVRVHYMPEEGADG